MMKMMQNNGNVDVGQCRIDFSPFCSVPFRRVFGKIFKSCSKDKCSFLCCYIQLNSKLFFIQSAILLPSSTIQFSLEQKSEFSLLCCITFHEMSNEEDTYRYFFEIMFTFAKIEFYLNRVIFCYLNNAS